MRAPSCTPRAPRGFLGIIDIIQKAIDKGTARKQLSVSSQIISQGVATHGSYVSMCSLVTTSYTMDASGNWVAGPSTTSFEGALNATLGYECMFQAYNSNAQGIYQAYQQYIIAQQAAIAAAEAANAAAQAAQQQAQLAQIAATNAQEARVVIPNTASFSTSTTREPTVRGDSDAPSQSILPNPQIRKTLGWGGEWRAHGRRHRLRGLRKRGVHRPEHAAAAAGLHRQPHPRAPAHADAVAHAARPRLPGGELRRRGSVSGFEGQGEPLTLVSWTRSDLNTEEVRPALYLPDNGSFFSEMFPRSCPTR